MSVAVNEDKILVPKRKAPCATCDQVTYHANIADSWLCIVCGTSLYSRENETDPTSVALHGERLIHAMAGRYGLSYRVIEALKETGQAPASQIAKAAKASASAVRGVLQRLYEADLVIRYDSQGRHWTNLWALNRANPETMKVLAIVEPGPNEDPRPW